MTAVSTRQPLKPREKAMDEFPIMEDKPGNIVLFHPHIPAAAIDAVTKVLESRWIGQGRLVDEFERKFAARFAVIIRRLRCVLERTHCIWLTSSPVCSRGTK
jgi:hypothetical protein